MIYVISDLHGCYDKYIAMLNKLQLSSQDGRLLGCCSRKYATSDVNVFDVGLINAVRSPKYIEAKECLMTVHPDREHYGSCTCFDCDKRLQREAEGLAFEIV